jgi:hypothetical protein
MTKAVPARVVELLLIFATILSERRAAGSKAFDLRHSGFVIRAYSFVIFGDDKDE